MPRPASSFASVAGVPLHYDRLPGQYGTHGHPRQFPMTPEFHARLEACFEELWRTCPLGTADVIATAGAWVHKPGAHGEGRGFDIDAIFWPEKAFVTLHYPNDRPFYLAVESVLRKHFGTVLNYLYNAAHQDHFHIDDLAPVGFIRTHRSRMLYLQSTLTHVFERPVDIDGVWGPQSAGAVASTLAALELAEVGNPSDVQAVGDALAAVWPEFLDRSADRAFRDSLTPDIQTPRELLRNVYAAVDSRLAETPGRKDVEAAITAFVEHPQIAEVLDREE